MVHVKPGLLLLALALTTTVFAGCFGGDEAPKANTAETGNGGSVTVVGNDGEDGEDVERFNDQSGGLNVPAAHFHHYWGDNEQVDIYRGAIPWTNLNAKHLNQNTLAWAEWDLETDGDDVSLEGNSQPIVNGKADTVFAGTNKITVEFPPNFPQGVGAVVFWYKPSGTPKYLPENGIHITPENTKIEIDLNEVGMADPPHQFVTSRWKFRAVATNGFCEQFELGAETCPPAFITEQSALTSPGGLYNWGDLIMTAHNGGENSLDPPHPDFWTAGDIRSLGMTSGEVADPAVQTPLIRERVSALTDIAMPPNNIVPLGAEKVIVKLSWTNSIQPPPGTTFMLKLQYHGADTLEYANIDNVEGSGTEWTYTIFDSDQTKVDPPYESNSFWRFKLVPTLIMPDGSESENTGAFQGTYDLSFEAHKKPGFVLT